MWVPSLPISVRLSLWVTAAWAVNDDPGPAVVASAPDVEPIDPPVELLRLWRDLGESALLVALPRPGQAAMMPHCTPDVLGAAVAAGEAVFVPGLGGCLIPRLERFGSDLEPGWSVRWEAGDCDPVPTYVLEALSLRETDRRLRAAVADALEVLESLDGGSWQTPSAGPVGSPRTGGGHGLPPTVPGHAARVIELAGRIGSMCEAGLAGNTMSVAAHGASSRDAALRHLSAEADQALAEATCIAAMSMAGLRAGRL